MCIRDSDGIHQNPHVSEEISTFREIVWDIYYSSYFVAAIIRYLANLLRSFVERKDYTQHSVEGTIYQGYGACYIIGKVFFENYDSLWAPTFLMGEEYFLSKQLKDKGYGFYYEPRIQVKHHDHATCDKVPSKKLWEIARDSHKVYRQYVKPFSKNK